MARLEDIDPSREIHLIPMQQDLDYPSMDIVETLQIMHLSGAEVPLFLQWASTNTWRKVFETDLQSISEDYEHKALLSTWISLYTFRYEFCGGGRQMQDEATKALMERIWSATRSWREHHVDLVGIDGYLLAPGIPRKRLDGGNGSRHSPVSTAQLIESLDVIGARQSKKH